MNKVKRLAAVLLCLVLLMCSLCATAQAADAIDLDRNGSISISFIHEGKPIPGAKFELFCVANVSSGGKLTASEAFASYPINMIGLDQEGWQGLALTLQGYIDRDGVTSVAFATTDASGAGLLSNLKPGLYLLLGENVTIHGVTYMPKPVMLSLPGVQQSSGEWDYNVTVLPKAGTQGEYVEPVSRKVLKVWDDENNNAAKRPESITVDLLKNGEIYDTQVLTAAENWRYTWAELDGDAIWSLAEREIDGYNVRVDLQGSTFVVTNSLAAEKYCEHDPPIKKTVVGDAPNAALFRFSLEAVSNTAGLATMPMPAGSDGQVKIKEVWGGGEYEFGWIRFTEPGTYVYRMREVSTGLPNYTYDSTSYTVTYVVTDDSASPTGMSVVRTITKDGQTVETAEFVNKYDPNGGPSPTPTTTPSTVTPTPTPDPGGPKLPKTGQLKWPIPVLLIAGACFVMAGLYRKKRDKDEYES